MRALRRRIAFWGGALALTLSSSLVYAQDGQPVVGPPVTAPKTNKNKANEVTQTPPTRVGSQVLPGVPATASDPAPPGTRALPATGVPTQGVAPATTVPGVTTTTTTTTTGTNPPGTTIPGAADLPPSVMMAEGVVTKLSKPGDALPEARIQFDLNTAETWADFATRATGGLPTTPAPARSTETKAIDKAARKLEAAANKLEDAANKIEGTRPAAKRRESAPARQPRVLTMVVTRKTTITKYARTPDGRDLLQGNPNATDIKPSRSGDSNTTITRDQLPEAANFTNIHEGSFVAVRYRRAGDVNEALSLSLIELPRTTGTTPNPAAVVPTQTPATPVVPVVPGRVPATGAAPSGVVPVVPVVPTTPGRTTAAPVRTPVVPTAPVAPGGP